ncbi:hypothetical protein [Actinoallomurus iriomotensis]|uniref:PH domain-containing protein n=1 Tax=Actinoallomurus iriomotensis TaxID=478107 RepID=A0A9W6RZ20_9ACTN|nr:hypothetical protein [Actinoallomurus iriomotensis]GLY84134.1 hypothetical protein Airi02_020630 [Actinoallomurus iriomotensis]
MEQKSDFRLPVAAAPAYLTATVAAVSAAGALVVLVMVGYLVATMNRLSREPSTTIVFVFFPVLAFGLLASATVMAVLARGEFRLLRDPPVFTADGLRLRVFARRGYDVFVPWERVARLRIADQGPRPFLVVDVPGAEDLVGDDPGKAERLRRTAERFEGAAFVYGLRGALIHAEDLDAVVERLSDGAVALDY